MTNDTMYASLIKRPSAFAGRLMSAGRRLLSALALAVGLFFIAPTALAP